MRVGEKMTKEVITISPKEGVTVAKHTLDEKGIRHRRAMSGPPAHVSPDELYAAAEKTLRPIFKSARRREPFAIEPAAEMAERLARVVAKESPEEAIKNSFSRPRTLILQTLGSDPGKLDLVRHSLNVAICALRFGVALGYPLTKLTELAIVGMFHDVGLTWIPEAILSKPGPLSKNERDLINTHPLNSYEILRTLDQNWEWLADVALQHHERKGGTGYPKGLRSHQIHEYAKIIGICDIYEAITHGGPHRQGIEPFDAMREILETERGRFSWAILRMFLNVISCYPVGSWVRLSSDEIGQVVATNKDSPLRPVLEVSYDASGAKLPQTKVIDLNKEVLLHITGPAARGRIQGSNDPRPASARQGHDPHFEDRRRTWRVRLPAPPSRLALSWRERRGLESLLSSWWRRVRPPAAY